MKEMAAAPALVLQSCSEADRTEKPSAGPTGFEQVLGTIIARFHFAKIAVLECDFARNLSALLAVKIEKAFVRLNLGLQTHDFVLEVFNDRDAFFFGFLVEASEQAGRLSKELEPIARVDFDRLVKASRDA